MLQNLSLPSSLSSSSSMLGTIHCCWSDFIFFIILMTFVVVFVIIASSSHLLNDSLASSEMFSAIPIADSIVARTVEIFLVDDDDVVVDSKGSTTCSFDLLLALAAFLCLFLTNVPLDVSILAFSNRRM